MHKIISLTIAVVFTGITFISAQIPTIQSPAGGDLPEWSADSQYFVYQNTSKNLLHVTQTPSEIFMAAPYWESFNPQTGAWFESNVWPLYPKLSNVEQSIF